MKEPKDSCMSNLTSSSRFSVFSSLFANGDDSEEDKEDIKEKGMECKERVSKGFERDRGSKITEAYENLWRPADFGNNTKDADVNMEGSITPMTPVVSPVKEGPTYSSVPEWRKTCVENDDHQDINVEFKSIEPLSFLVRSETSKQFQEDSVQDTKHTEQKSAEKGSSSENQRQEKKRKMGNIRTRQRAVKRKPTSPALGVASRLKSLVENSWIKRKCTGSVKS